ncbi:MAG: Crp/Fnr family transcriptional regulator [Brevundimonas sp.]|uniref:Crp/Fnr family transcriptional regulator n=1 Tax=Brevundimonas sp. TaxID=1871086 RepID=UPI002723CDFD|nr:Crp/Fnr family transcriptional regulator [Brevundimonas sp.]MDZ4319576.1 Crp/Fnr family transcriptional regulator [Phenylobacterium sp.]MDO9586856.1 Crp/Fnr family transcriptional regulator [Brevundimonas sp.]MDP3369105.1 Crp/Fnr family transcriptional regulator [Brevundimonas sp.]MDP3657416.1 Crp/Fnr family transcriptional regulator [Brevundimonas sp.]MDZ4113205.1 Crp/Fnr family transcriptional regulator [Brevundimonas sp.]
MEIAAVGRILGTDPWLGALPSDTRTALLGAARIRTIDNGAAVYRAGDPGDGLHAVLEGEIRLIGHSESGRRLVYLILRPGDWFGEMSVLDGKPRFHDAIAFGPSVILHVGSTQIDMIAAGHPRFDRAIGALTCQHQRAALAFVEQALTASSEARLAFILTEMAGRHGRPVGTGVEIDLRLSQEDLAAMVGVSRQSLAALLGRLRRERVIETRYARLVILDFEKLKQKCGRQTP